MELKHGYTLRDIDQMMHAAVIADRTLALDYQTRRDIAWSAIAAELYEADEPPHRQALIRVGWQAIYAEVRTMNRTRGYADGHTDEYELRPRFLMFWGKHVEPSHEERVVERVAVHQVLAQLRPTYRDAIAALAVHDNYQSAAAAMGLRQGAFNFRIAHARKELVALWLEHETPHHVRRTDRRVEVAGKELATHCGNGHEWTAENTRWSRVKRSGGKRRDCRACESERSRRRTAARKAPRSDAA